MARVNKVDKSIEEIDSIANARSKKVAPREENEYQLELLEEIKGDTVFIHNISGANFHIRPTSFKPSDIEDAIPFEVNEVKTFSKEQVNNTRFKEALIKKKLRIISESEANEVASNARKSLARSGKKQGGLYSSGLPQNSKAALDYIYNCEDIDELEAYQELEDREVINAAIDDRIEKLEDGEFGYSE